MEMMVGMWLLQVEPNLLRAPTGNVKCGRGRGSIHFYTHCSKYYRLPRWLSGEQEIGDLLGEGEINYFVKGVRINY